MGSVAAAAARMSPLTWQYSGRPVAASAACNVADVICAPCVGKPIALAGTVVPANAVQRAAAPDTVIGDGATGAAGAGAAEGSSSEPPQPTRHKADATENSAVQ